MRQVRRGVTIAASLLVLIGALLLSTIGPGGTAADDPEPPAEGPTSGPGPRESADRGGLADVRRGCRPTEVSFRDLADGRAIAGLAFTPLLRPGSDCECAAGPLSTSDAGRTRACLVHWEGIRVPPPWRVPERATPSEWAESGVIWLSRSLRVVARVFRGTERTLVPLDRLKLSVMAAPPGPALGTGGGVTPWSLEWLARHGLDRTRPDVRPTENGEAEIVVPAVRGQTLVAESPGFRPSKATLQIPVDPDLPAYVDLELEERPLRVRGVLRDSDGRPIRGVRLALYVTCELAREDLDPARLRLAGHPYTAGTRADGSAYVSYTLWTNTGSDRRDGPGPGEFVFESNVAGDALIVVWSADGYRPLRVRLGELEGDREGCDLTLEAGQRRRVELRFGAQPLAGVSVVIGDLSVGDVQPAIRLETDRDGCLAAHVFENGRRYSLVIMRGTSTLARGYLTWRGAESIDVTKDLDEKIR